MRGEFEGVSFEKAVTLAPARGAVVTLRARRASRSCASSHPRLWWPNGYGKPELYHLTLSVLDAAQAR